MRRRSTRRHSDWTSRAEEKNVAGSACAFASEWWVCCTRETFYRYKRVSEFYYSRLRELSFFFLFFCFTLYHVFRLLLLLVRSRRSWEIFFCLRRRFAINKTAEVSYSGYGTRSMFRKIRYRHDGKNENTRVPIKPWSASNRNFADVPISTHLLLRHICAKRLFKAITYS